MGSISKTKCKPSCRSDSSSKWDIDPLAIPRGKKILCEICQSDRCRYHCLSCRNVFYCSKEHRERDFNSIHKHICKRLEFLRRPDKATHSDERLLAQRQNTATMIEILNISKELASDSLIEERLEDALDQLRVAFSFGIKIYGEKSFKLIELFGFMTDTFIRMGLLSKAVEQHKKAEIIIKDPENDCPADKDIIMADFYKHEGFIHQAQLNFTESLRS